MDNKSFTDNKNNNDGPNNPSVNKKSLISSKTNSNRVDINVLKSKLQENEQKEFKKNLYILSFLILGLGALGIYLSL